MTRAVSVYGVHFNAQGEVLLVKDAHSRLWGFPGGGVEDGEAHDDTLRREFLEETGLHVAGESRYIAEQTDAHKQRFFYAVDGVAGVLLKTGNDSDIEKVAYFSVEHLALPDSVPELEEVILMAQ